MKIKVVQKDLTGNVINKYESYATAAKTLGCNESTIRRAAKSNTRVFGKFMFENESEETEISIPDSPRILLLDIETSPTLSYTFGIWNQNINPEQITNDWYMLCAAAKWLDNKEVFSTCLTPEEVANEDDSIITNMLWELLDEADIVVGHNCVEVSTPILKQDLTWVNAGNIKVGDKLIGFEEKIVPGEPTRKNRKWLGVEGKERQVRPATVTHFNTEKQECLKIIFDNGDEIITTKTHYWLGMAEKDNNKRWYKTEDLRVGQRINKLLNVWDIDKSYEAGWLSGFIAGEGTLKGSLKDSKSCVASIDFCQRPTVVLEEAIKHFKTLNIPISLPQVKVGGLGRGDTLYSYTLGGKWKTLEILGKLQIQRLINKINWNKFGGLSGNISENSPVQIATIVDIVDVGIKEIAVITTDEKTYIANGYPMHNCSNFDIPRINTRFLSHRLLPPSPYKQVDTLQIARKHFAFTSNKLDYINRYLGLDRKKETNFNLWKRCVQGDKEALNIMEDYNRNDVIILEDTYKILRPFMAGHPNIDVYKDNQNTLCTVCGSTNLTLVENKYFYTQTSKYSLYRCMDCGGLSRGKKNLVPKKIISAIPK